MTDNRTVEQRLAAVAASMTMAGYTMTEADREESRRILRGEVSADESVHQVLADASRDATDFGWENRVSAAQQAGIVTAPDGVHQGDAAGDARLPLW